MKPVTARQIQDLDRLAIQKHGIPSLVLMENAGAAVAREILRDFPKSKLIVSVLCGPGNNGGDGFVIARYLRDAGARVRVFLLGRKRDLKPDAAVNCAVLSRQKIRVEKISFVSKKMKGAVKQSDVLVDALFGVGLNRTLAKPLCALIRYVNASGKPILAVDVPSGLDATSGEIWGEAIRAYKTVTFTFPKTGFARAFGPECCGQGKVVQIGIPVALKRKLATVPRKASADKNKKEKPWRLRLRI